MAYCANTDVQAEFKSLTYNSAGVTSAKVDEWITQADAYINSKVGVKYLVPVTSAASPISFSVLKMISTWLVADRVKDILYTLTGTPSADQNSKQGDLKLSDATLVSSSDGVSSFSYENGEEHTFQKNVNQW